jgi:hypothetical protein
MTLLMLAWLRESVFGSSGSSLAVMAIHVLYVSHARRTHQRPPQIRIDLSLMIT